MIRINNNIYNKAKYRDTKEMDNFNEQVELNRYIGMCERNGICPQCGYDLSVKELIFQNGEQYKCKKCHYKSKDVVFSLFGIWAVIVAGISFSIAIMVIATR